MESLTTMHVCLGSGVVVNTDENRVAIPIGDGSPAAQGNIAIATTGQHDLVTCTFEIVFELKGGFEI